MAEGYLTASGYWVEGSPSDANYQGNDRFVIQSTDEEFAETVVRRRAAVVTDELSQTPIIVDHLPSGGDVMEFLNRSSDGAVSFFDDLIWYGYGLVAVTGALGDTQKADVLDTMAAVERALTDVVSNNRVCFAASMYVNYTIHHGLPEFLGRSLTSIVVQTELQAAVGVAAPWAWRAHSAAIFLASTFGSFLRLGDTMRENLGDLSSMTAFDLLLVALNGTDDPNVLRSNQQNMKEALVETLDELAEGLEDASSPPLIFGGTIFDTNAFSRQDLARYALEMRGLAETMAALPVTNILAQDEFFTVLDRALILTDRLESSHLWQHLPRGVRTKIQFFQSLYNPIVCDTLSVAFEYLLRAARSGAVLVVPGRILERIAAQINWMNQQ